VTLAEGAQVAGTAFAALAAGASWASVAQTRKLMRESTQPELHVQTLHVGPQRSSAGKHLALVIYNAGSGIAKQTGFCFVSGGQLCEGFVGSGFLRSNETAHIGTDLSAGPTHGVVFCITRENEAHVWNVEGGRKTLKFNEDKPLVKAKDAYALHYPGDDIATLDKVGSRLGGPTASL
jgi:hypothetical protein